MASIRMVLDSAELADAQRAALAVGVDLEVEPQAEFVEPITAVLIGGGVLLLGKFIVDLLDRLKGGVLIDLRPDAVSLVRRDKSVPFGWAIVIAPDGSVKISVHDAPKDAAERLLEKIIDGSLKTAKDVGKAAAEALGPQRVVEGKA